MSLTISMLVLAVLATILAAPASHGGPDIDRSAADFVAPADIKWVRNAAGTNEQAVLFGDPITAIVGGHGDVMPRTQLAFFRGYLADLVAGVKKGAADGASVDDIKRALPDQLAPKYEKGMSKYPIGQYRDRVGVNIELVYAKVVKKG